MNKLLCALLLAASLPALAADLEVKSPWVRSTVAGQAASGAFMELSSSSGVTVVGVDSPVAGAAEVHEMKTENGIMKMRAVRELSVPAGQSVKLAPGGYHVMLMDLKSQLKPGDSVPLVLKIKDKNGKQQRVEIKAEVRDMTAPSAMPAEHEKMHESMHQHMHGEQK